MQQMQELLCAPWGKMWLEFVSVKWNCAKTLNATFVSFVHVYVSMFMSVLRKVLQVYV